MYLSSFYEYNFKKKKAMEKIPFLRGVLIFWVIREFVEESRVCSFYLLTVRASPYGKEAFPLCKKSDFNL